jgi:hypothetical protein
LTYRTIHASQNGNISANRNQLRYLSLAFAVGPQFQRLLKIQHRRWGWVAPNPVGAGVIEEARYAGLREKSGNGLLIGIRPEGQTGTTRF